MTTEREAEIANATRLGFELGKAEGRKQGGLEVLADIHGWMATAEDGLYDEWLMKRGAIKSAYRLDEPSRTQEATSEPLTAPTGHSDLPEAPETALRACGCTFETSHNYGCPTGGGRIDSIRIPRGEG